MAVVELKNAREMLKISMISCQDDHPAGMGAHCTRGRAPFSFAFEALPRAPSTLRPHPSLSRMIRDIGPGYRDLDVGDIASTGYTYRVDTS